MCIKQRQKGENEIMKSFVIVRFVWYCYGKYSNKLCM